MVKRNTPGPLPTRAARAGPDVLGRSSGRPITAVPLKQKPSSIRATGVLAVSTVPPRLGACGLSIAVGVTEYGNDLERPEKRLWTVTDHI